MRHAGRLLAIGLMAVAAVAQGGCSSTTNGAVAPDTPLWFDPTDEYVLGEWWTNGEQLLRLRNNYGYDLYADSNRFKEPIERGQWSQKNYATLQFEPYSLRDARVERVTIDKASNGGIILVIRNLKPFAPIEGPPEVMEDHILGAWWGEEFSIDVHENGRYRFERVRPLEPGTRGVAGHDGSWELVDDALVLHPDPIGLEPMLLRLTLRDNAIVPDGLRRK